MNPALCALALSLGLAACQSRPIAAPAPLAGNYLACRSAETVELLRRSGTGFQRKVDDETASGNCRRFAAGELVRDRVLSPALTRFVDPRTGFTYWTYAPY